MPLYNYRKRRLEIKIEPGDKPSVGYEINYKEKWSVSRPPTGPREVRECWTEESARPAASVRELKKSRTTQPSLSVEDVENESGDSPCRVQQSPAEQVRAVRLDRFATLAVVEGIDGTTPFSPHGFSKGTAISIGQCRCYEGAYQESLAPLGHHVQ